ncbi:cell adhesion molecule CEACAM3-like [Mantella aurantiaca]
MMKNSMNSPTYRALILTALLCLWITPTFSHISIMQNPMPAKIGEEVNLTVSEIPPSLIICIWFRGETVVESKRVSTWERCSNETSDKENGITIDKINCTLKIHSLTQKHIDRFTLFVANSSMTDKGNIVINGAEQFVLPSTVFLSVAVLVSSWSLF